MERLYQLAIVCFFVLLFAGARETFSGPGLRIGTVIALYATILPWPFIIMGQKAYDAGQRFGTWLLRR